MSETFREVEAIALAELTNPMVATSNPEAAAIRWAGLLKEVKEATGHRRYATPWEIIRVANSKQFEGLSCHSWGLMVGKKKYETTKTLLIERVRYEQSMLNMAVSNSDDPYLCRIEEFKTESRLPRPREEYLKDGFTEEEVDDLEKCFCDSLSD